MDCGDGKVRAEIGAFQAPVAKTAAYTLLHTDAGKIFTNSGAVGPVTFTLPVTAAGTPGIAAKRITGMFFTFVKVTNQNIVIAPGTGASINFNTATTGNYQNVTTNGTQGASGNMPSCKVLAVSETEWVVFPGTGTWANA